jgi:1,4-dihydroxy-2-naphthoate octaprenyltransferase
MNPWIQAARLRTLPLAMAGILLGSAVAFLEEKFNLPVFLWGLGTAVFLQILSNFSNDYGDYLKGTDTSAMRQDRMMAAGKIGERQMKMGLVIISVLCVISGIMLLYVSGNRGNNTFILFVLLGLVAMVAAIKYTVGKRAYGYIGLGDIFVMVFFGIVAVCGIYFLHAGRLNSMVFMAAIGIGALSTGVLNINNIRDIESDKSSGKITVAVRLGRTMALKYHRILLAMGFVLTSGSFVVHLFQQQNGISMIEYMMVAVLFIPVGLLLAAHDSRMRSMAPEDRAGYNKELKALSLTSLLFTVLYWVISLFYMGAVF